MSLSVDKSTVSSAYCWKWLCSKSQQIVLRTTMAQRCGQSRLISLAALLERIGFVVMSTCNIASSVQSHSSYFRCMVIAPNPFRRWWKKWIPTSMKPNYLIISIYVVILFVINSIPVYFFPSKSGLRVRLLFFFYACDEWRKQVVAITILSHKPIRSHIKEADGS